MGRLTIERVLAWEALDSRGTPTVACAVALAGGAAITRAEPMHGKTDRITHDGSGLFDGLPDPLTMTRYHSLVAGHLPPILVSGGTATALMGAGGPMVGLVASRRESQELLLRPGDVLVLYTDGLVERRGEHLDDGLERLRDAAWERRSEAVQVLTDGLLDELLTGDVTDDVVLVVKRFDPPRS